MSRFRALVQHSTLAKKSYDYQHKPGKWAEVNMNLQIVPQHS